MHNAIFIKYSDFRRKEFQTKTVIYREKEILKISKCAVCPEGENHIRNFVENHELLKKAYPSVTPIPVSIEHGAATFPYCCGVSLDSKLEALLNKPNALIVKLTRYMNLQIEAAEEYIELFTETDDFSAIFGDSGGYTGLSRTCSNVDLVASNIFEESGKLHCIDYEWVFSFPIPVRYLQFRMALNFYIRHHAGLNRHFTENSYFNTLGFSTTEVEVYKNMECRFQYYVIGTDQYISRYRRNVIPLDISNFNNIIADRDQAIKQVSEYSKHLEEAYDEKQKLNQISGHLLEVRKELDCANSEKLVALTKIKELQNELYYIQKVSQEELDSRLGLLSIANRIINEVLKACEMLNRSRLFKLVHLINRWKRQGFSSNREERKAFRRWFISRFFHKVPDNNHTYNPLYQVVIPLMNLDDNLTGFIDVAMAGTVSEKIAQILVIQDSFIKQDQKTRIFCPTLADDYKKYDVVVFSIIDYNFRYQRPQQIADHFAREGHRVFYINANFTPDGEVTIKQKKEGLWLVTLPDEKHTAIYSNDFSSGSIELNTTLDKFLTENGIRDALLIADYPNWVSGILYLKERYGFTVVTDYMDDFSGFDNAQEKFVEQACVRLLKNSALVVASSNYLADIARQYNTNTVIIRNGTEYSHFHVAHVAKTCNTKIIGYYGAIAHWFDVDKIEYLSNEFPDCNIVLIGEITAGVKRLKKLHNVKLLGEIPYAQLPEHLRDFDVCLIPFDASTNLIKATNPVKFYEYLSAGKKIVATEIPELEPFRNKYAYLASDNEQFAEYVRLCLDGTDTLASMEECFSFARENDWTSRVAQFREAAEKQFPQISIVVLCYNQLDYTKMCVDSILRNTAYPHYEIVMVDNNSTDGTAAWMDELAAAHDNVKIVLNKTNRGFAGGNNDGIAVSGGEYIVLLNNDTIVTRGWLTGLVKQFAGNEKIGIVGPITNSAGNEAMVQLAYSSVLDMPAAAYDYTANHMGEIYPHDGSLAMFCVMFSRQLTEEIGLLDENYGTGMFEDDDYTMAAKRAGYKNVMVEDVFIHHFGSVSFKKLEDEKYRALFEKNKAYYEIKWGVKWKMHHPRT